MLREYYRTVLGITRNAKLFMLGSFFVSFGLSVFMLLFNLYLKEQGFNKGEIGTVLMCGSLGAALAALPAAFLIERVHIKQVLIAAVVFAACAYGLQISSEHLWLIAVWGYVASMFITACRVASSPFFMRNSTHQERMHLFSVNSAIMMLAFFSGYLFGGYLPDIFCKVMPTLQLVDGQKYALYLGVSISLIGVVPFLWITQKSVPVIRTHWLVKLKGYDWHIIWRLMLPKLLVGLGAGLVIPFMNLYFKEVFDLVPKKIGMCYSGMQVMVFLAMLAAPLITRRLGVVKTIVASELLSIPFMLILAITGQLWLAILAFIIRGALMNMSWPVSNKFEMELVKPADQAVTNAISQLSWMGSWAVSSQIGGYIIERYSYSMSFYITICLYFSSAVCYYLFFRNAQAHEAHRNQ